MYNLSPDSPLEHKSLPTPITLHSNLLFSYRVHLQNESVCTYLTSISPIRLPHKNKNHVYLVQHTKPKHLDSIWHKNSIKQNFFSEWTNEPHMTVFFK